MNFFSVLLFLNFFALGKTSGICVVEIQRKPCPGMESKALAPYNGKTTTREVFQVDDKEDCLKKAEYIGKIVREKSLAEKQVRAEYDGVLLGQPIVFKASCRKYN